MGARDRDKGGPPFPEGARVEWNCALSPCTREGARVEWKRGSSGTSGREGARVETGLLAKGGGEGTGCPLWALHTHWVLWRPTHTAGLWPLYSPYTTTSAAIQNDQNGLDSTWRCAMCRRRHAHGLPLSLAVWVKFLGASVKWVARVLRLPSIAKRNRRADRGPRAMGRSHDGRLVKRRPSAAALGGTLRRR